MSRLLFRIVILLLPLECIGQDRPKEGPVPDKATAAHESRASQQSASVSADTQNVIRNLEARQEHLRSAPEGYEYLDRDGYRLLILAPMALEGRDDRVTKVSTMGTRMLVLAGDPIAVDDSNDGAMLSAFGEFLSDVLHSAWVINFPKVKSGKHWGWQIGFHLKNLSGTAFGIIGKGRIVPIICANQEEHLIFDPNTSKQEQAITNAKFRAQRADQQSTETMCQQMFQSVELQEDDGELFPRAAQLYDAVKAQRSTSILQQTPPEQSEASQPTLGDVGRDQRARAVPRTVIREGSGDPDWAPAGFRWLDLSGICRPQCNSSRALLPDRATAIPDYREVFQVAVDKAVISLYVGSLRTWTGTASVEPSLWQQEKFAVPVFYVRLENNPAVTVLFQEEREIRGSRAKISRVRLVDGAGNVFLGEGAVFKVVGDVGIGCLVPENKFGEFEPVCAAMINSFETR